MASELAGQVQRTVLAGRSSWRIWTHLRAVVGSPVALLAAVVAIASLVSALAAPQLAPHDPLAVDPVNRLRAVGTPEHLLGTDLLGRDVLARLMYGARLAWIVGGSVAVASTILGCLLGLVGGYYGRWIDAIFSRLTDALVGIPGLLLALVFAAIFGPGTSTAIAALSIVSSPVVARVIRSCVLVERELDYVRASRGLGNREIRTLLKHVFPNVVSPLVVVGTQIASRSIIVESSLSFLGVGTQPPDASWGLMIKEGRSVFLSSPEVVIVPAVVLSLTVVAINVLADFFSDRFDPTGRVSGASGATRET